MGILRRTPTRPRARIIPAGRRALTASAASPNTREAGGTKALSQPWQPEAFRYYASVPECWYPAQFYARTMKRIRYYPAVLNDQGEPEEVEDGPLVEVFDRIRDSSGGMAELAASYGRLMFLAGEGYLVVSEQDGEEVWEFLSPLELKVDRTTTPGGQQQYRRQRTPGAETERLVEAPADDFGTLSGDQVRIWRFWRRSPEFSGLADSPIRAVLDLYALLASLTLAAGGEALSRAAQRGAFYWPEELELEPVNPIDGEDPAQHPVMERLREGYERAIQNPGSAEAAMPFLVEGPAMLETANGKMPGKDAMGWLAMGPSDRYLEGEIWPKVIERIANGLDLPKQTVTGEAMNHWGDWIIDEQGFRLHVAPVTEDFCSDIGTAYFQPAAKAANVTEWDRAVIWYDEAEAINHPDETKTAMEAFALGLVNTDYALAKIGATEDDAATEDDRAWVLLLKGKSAGDPNAQGGETSPADGGRGGDTVEEAPAAPAAVAASAAPAALTQAKILGAAEIAIDRARDLAGARLRRKSQSCPECMEKIHGVPNALVAATLGADTVRSVLDGHGSEAELVAGAGRVLTDRLLAWEINGGWPEKLGTLAEEYATRTLYETVAPALPPGFAAACAKAAQ